MLDKKQAYAILGLEENATEEAVEKRYEVLLLKKKGRAGEENGAAGEPTMSDITAAYKFIKSAAIEEVIKQTEPKSKAVQKTSHIWEYYRWHIIGSIIAVVVIIYTCISIFENRQEERRIANADIKITFFTDYQVQNADPLETQLLSGLKDWKDVHLVYQYAPLNPKDEFAMAMLQKSMISMAADKADMYIIDPGNFEKFGKQGAFLRLDDIPALSGLAKEKLRFVEVEKEGKMWAGIDVSDHPAIKSLNLPAGQKIAAIRVNANKKDNAVKALQWLSKP